MANVLSLAMKISADATGVRQSLSSVERAIIQLDKETSSITAAFDKFASTSSKAAEVQRTFQTRLEALNNALKSGAITDAREYTAALAQLSAEAKNAADRVGEAEAITRRFRTEQQRQTAELELYNQRFQEGLLNQETYNAAAIESLGINKLAADAARQRADALAEAERSAAKAFDSQLAAESAEAAKASAAAEKERADAVARAAEIVTANLTKEQLATRTYEQSVAELNRLRSLGVLGEEDYGRALQRSANDFAKATIEANKLADATDKIGDGGTLKFNELSGILAALPGPIGNVAGRLSGLASAGEGLSRVFGAGLSQGLRSIGASVAGLINPFTAAVAGVAAFGAGAVAVTQGLIALDDRVERLGNTADKLGVSFGFIQTLEEAAERSGTSIDAVSAAFGRLQRSVLGVDEESKAAQKALSEIGVTAEELQALSPEEQYRLIGESLAAIEDPARRTATATALFGKAGAELIPFFNNLPGATADIERFGRALTEIDRGRIDDFGAGLDTLRLATQGLGQSLLLPFAGLGEGIARSFAEITAGITAVIDPIGQTLEPVLTLIGTLIEGIGIGLGTLGRIIGTVFQPFATVAQAASQAIQPLSDGVLSLVRYFSDGQVAVSEWIVSFTPIGVIADSIGALGETISRVVTIITTAFGRIGEIVGDTLGSVAEYVGSAVSSFAEFTGLSGALSAIGGVISSVFGSISSIFSTIAEAIGGTVGRLLTMAENFLGIDRAASDAAEGVDKTAESVVTLTAEQQKAMTEVQKAIADSGKALDGAIEKAGEFGQAGFDAAFEFQQALEDLQEQANSGELNAEQYARGVANATAEYDRQIESLKVIQEETRKAAEEAERKAEADRQVSDQLLEQARIQREFGGDTERAQAADQVLAVEREIARVREEVAAAGEGGDEQAVANGEERIRQLEEIRNQQQAVADGSAAAAESERQRLEDQRARVDELLAAGQEQTQVERQIIDVQEQQAQATADLLAARQAGTQAEADAAAARLAQLDQLQSKLEDQQQASEQGFGEGFAQAFQQVDQAIGQTINKAAEFGNAGAEAAARLQEGIAAAQEQARDGILNKEAFDNEVARQNELFDQELKNIDAAEKARADAVKANERAIAEAAKADEDRQKEQQRAAAQQQQAVAERQKAAFEEQRRLAEEQAKADAAEFDRQEKRLTELNTLGPRQVQTADVRTQEGQQLVLDLFNQQQDPQLIQLRSLNKIMTRIATSIDRDLNRLGQPATIFP